MTPLRIAASSVIELSLIVIAVGLGVRGRWRLSWVFDVNILAAITFSVAMSWWPRFGSSAAVWQVSQSTFDLLRFCFALEVGWRTFRPFPGARKGALWVALAILVLTAVTVGAVPLAGSQASAFQIARAQFHPRVIIGSLWLMVAVLAVARWYRVPVHPFHSAILPSWAAYVALWSALLSLIGRYGRDFAPYADWLDVVACLLLMCWWGYVTWRPESVATLAHVKTIHRIEVGVPACG